MNRPEITTRSNVLRPKRPNHANGRTTRKLMASSKYHLFEKKRYGPASRARSARGASILRTHRW